MNNKTSNLRYGFEVFQEDDLCASGISSSPEAAFREANMYAMMYSQDGPPATIRFYKRTELSLCEMEELRPE